jgi:hypothetical protein
LLTGAETVVDIWLHCGSDYGILSSENEVGSTEESASGGRSDALEHLAPAVKVEKCSESPSKEKFHGLIESKQEPVDSSGLADAAGQGAHSSYCITSSSLDHDYFGVMNVNFNEESEDGCESVQSLPGCESVQSLPGCESVQSLPACDSVQSLPGSEAVKDVAAWETE